MIHTALVFDITGIHIINMIHIGFKIILNCLSPPQAFVFPSTTLNFVWDKKHNRHSFTKVTFAAATHLLARSRQRSDSEKNWTILSPKTVPKKTYVVRHNRVIITCKKNDKKHICLSQTSPRHSSGSCYFYNCSSSFNKNVNVINAQIAHQGWLHWQSVTWLFFPIQPISHGWGPWKTQQETQSLTLVFSKRDLTKP